MRSIGRLLGGVLVVVVLVATMLAAPADARRPRHNRHHHATCGPGTALQNGACVVVDPPVGNSNLTVTPNPVQMTLGGHVAASISFAALLPFDVLVMNGVEVPDPCRGDCGPGPAAIGGIPCGPNAVLTVNPLPIVADADGLANARISDVTVPPGPGGCVPGTYPLVFFETVSPFRSFTAFITLVF